MSVSLKALGAFFLLASATWTAYSSCLREQKKLILLDAWIELLFYTKGQIDRYLTPREALLKNADHTLLRRCADGAKNPPGEWNALFQCAEKSLDGESRKLLRAFLGELGECYREEQLRRCDHYLNALERVRQALSLEIPRRMKLDISLCVCGALAITVLLW